MSFETPEMMEGAIRETGGVPVTFGGIETWCHREVYDPRVRDMFTRVRGRADVLIGPYERFVGIAPEAAILVGATPDAEALDELRVADFERLEEGGVIAIALKAAPPVE